MIKEIVVGQRFIGLSTDNKPTVGIHIGATLKELDTYNEFIYDGDKWIIENIKAHKYEWINETIEAQGYYKATIPCIGFDKATSFVTSTGNVQATFRVTKPDGEDYGWDALGIINEPSVRNTTQADITGVPYITIIVTNEGTEAVTSDIYVYLGRR